MTKEVFGLMILEREGRLRMSPLLFDAFAEADKRAVEIALNNKLMCWVVNLPDPRAANDVLQAPAPKPMTALKLIRTLEP